jgi:hypothetical protein
MRQERILGYGSSNSGKSYTWLTIAKILPNVHFYCIDTDRSIEAMLDEEFPDVHNVTVYNTFRWDVQNADEAKALVSRNEYTFKSALSDIVPKLRKSYCIEELDWLIIDVMNASWESIADWYIESVFGNNPADYFLATRKQLQQIHGGAPNSDEFSKSLLSGPGDYRVINKHYRPWISQICYQLECNLYCATHAYKLGTREDPLYKEYFSQYGVGPEGEPRLARRFHRIFLFENGGKDTERKQIWNISAAKARGNSSCNWEHHRIKNFPLEYLYGISNWRTPDQVAAENETVAKLLAGK